MDADGKGASCLDDGSMKQFLTDWYNWTEEGWCEIPALENASSAMQEDFYNGKLGAFVSSRLQTNGGPCRTLRDYG